MNLNKQLFQGITYVYDSSIQSCITIFIDDILKKVVYELFNQCADQSIQSQYPKYQLINDLFVVTYLHEKTEDLISCIVTIQKSNESIFISFLCILQLKKNTVLISKYNNENIPIIYLFNSCKIEMKQMCSRKRKFEAC